MRPRDSDIYIAIKEELIEYFGKQVSVYDLKKYKKNKNC